MGLPPNCAAGCRSSSATGKMTKPIIVDARAHMLGRLASIVAKQLLNGEHVVVVRCEEITLSGGMMRQRMKYERFLRKRHNTNPVKGPYHFRAPSRILWRTIRGMVPQKRMVIPDALKVLRLAAGHKNCTLGALSSSVGWKHGETVKELEEARKVKAAAYYAEKKKLNAMRAKAVAQVSA